jgi:hypothetical protein
MRLNTLYVVVMENAFGNLLYFGPFATKEGAEDWAKANANEALDWLTVIEVHGNLAMRQA